MNKPPTSTSRTLAPCRFGVSWRWTIPTGPGKLSPRLLGPAFMSFLYGGNAYPLNLVPVFMIPTGILRHMNRWIGSMMGRGYCVGVSSVVLHSWRSEALVVGEMVSCYRNWAVM